MNQTARLDFALPSEIDQLSVEPVTGSAPAILVQQASLVHAEGGVLAMQFLQLDHDSLHHGGQRDRVVDTRLRIANAKLDCVEERVQTDVPPDFFCVVDAAGADQQVQVVVVLGEALEGVGNAGARETFEDHLAVRFQSCVLAQPER